MGRVFLRILVSAYAVLSLLPAIAGAASATISLPLPYAIKAGQKITAPLNINVTNGDLGGVLLDIIYDPAAVNIPADGDIACVNSNYLCTANTRYSLSSQNTARVTCATGKSGLTGNLTLANVTFTGVGIKQGLTSIKIVPVSLFSSVDAQSSSMQPGAFSPVPAAITKRIFVRNSW